jgi:hypothetical protein
MELNENILKQAKEDIELVCAKYQIALVPVVVHQGDRTFSSIEIVPTRKPQTEAPATE